WGTHWFMLRLPKESLEHGKYAPYCTADCLRAWIDREHALLSFRAEELEMDWEEGEDWMDSLISLRADLLGRDLRALYLGWLSAASQQKIAAVDHNPPFPAELQTLPETSNSLAEFLGIETELLESAAEASADLEIALPLKDHLPRWIAGLPESEKDALLLE